MNPSDKPPHLIGGAWAVLRKDLKLELRNKSIFGTLIIFVLSTLLLVLFAMGQNDLNPKAEAGLLWIIILFTASLGLGRTFLSEQERGTVIFLKLHTQALMVYIGKLLFSFLTILCANSISSVVFLILVGVDVTQPSLFILVIFLGTLGLAGATTLLAAVISKTARGGSLLPVLLFPLLVPLLLTAVEATTLCFVDQPMIGDPWNTAIEPLVTMISFSGVVIAASILLFDYVWDQ